MESIRYIDVDTLKDVPALEKPAGYVYILKDVEISQRCKIGYTRNPSQRLKRFEVVLPFKTKLISLIKAQNARQLENWLHEKFAASQQGGEWFDLSDDDIANLRNLSVHDITSEKPDGIVSAIAGIEWDGVNRIDNVLSIIYGTEDNELNAWASRYPFIALIQREHEPHSDLIDIPLYIGDFSDFLEAMLPLELMERFTYMTARRVLSSKNLDKLFSSALIVEIQLTKSLSKRDMKRLKNILRRKPKCGVAIPVCEADQLPRNGIEYFVPIDLTQDLVKR